MEFRFAGLPERSRGHQSIGTMIQTGSPHVHIAGSSELQAPYRETCERSRQVVLGTKALDQVSAIALRDGAHFRCDGYHCTSSKRWLVTQVMAIYCANRSTATLVSS